jgi:GNAT superfamily N-acetyltransferase
LIPGPVNPPPLIRPAEPQDVPALLGLIRELAAYERLTAEVEATEDGLRESLFGPARCAEALLAWTDRAPEPVGIAVFFRNFSTFLARPGLWLEDLYVRPEHRGRGLGKALLLAVARIAEERGCGRFEWTVLDWNTPSIAFYERMGAEMKADWRIMRVSGPALRRLGRP